MSKVKNITNANNEEAKDATFEDRAVDDFVDEHDRIAYLIEHGGDVDIPMTIRLKKIKMAMLDHLAERWLSNRSNIAAELLEAMIWIVFKRVHKGITPEELTHLQEKTFREFEEKRNKTKPGKVKKRAK
jgi:hypothetical protein